MQSKSLLTLLKEENKLIREVNLFKETYEELCSVAPRLAKDYKEKQEEAENVLLNCKKEIARYLIFLEVLVKEDEE